MKHLYFWIALIILSSCTMHHGRNKLNEHLTRPYNLNEVDVRIHRDSYLETALECTGLFGVIAGNLGCARLYIPKPERTDLQPYCDVYIIDSDYVLEHELRHCEGWER